MRPRPERDPDGIPRQLEGLREADERYNAVFGPMAQELTNAGHLSEPDAVTGHATAIGRADERVTAPSGHEGAPARGADFPAAVRRRDQETHRSVQQARERIAAIHDRASDRRLGQELIDALTHPGEQIADAQLREHIDLLRQRIPVVPRENITALPMLDSGAEAQVYANHPENPDAVYKLVPTDEGRLAGGFISSRLAPDPDGGVRIVGEAIPTVLDLFERVRLGNAHGGPVFTEIAGVTPEGDVILKQPYVRGGETTDWLDAQMRLTEDVGLRPVSRDEQAAVARVGDDLVLFEDLHEGNVLHLPTGELFIIDSPARVLSEEEARLVRDNLPPDASGEGQSDIPFAVRPRPATEAGVREDASDAQRQNACWAWLRHGTRSPYFRRWFRDSKVVDADGEPMVVYEGTRTDFGVFEGDSPLRRDPEGVLRESWPLLAWCIARGSRFWLAQRHARRLFPRWPSAPAALPA